jgi:hypothetical protein
MLQERQREKAAKRAEREKEGVRGPVAAGEDPDLAGIVPGPQPIPVE